MTCDAELYVFSLDEDRACCCHLPSSQTPTHVHLQMHTDASRRLISAPTRACMSEHMFWRTVVGKFRDIPTPESPFSIREASCFALFVGL